MRKIQSSKLTLKLGGAPFLIGVSLLALSSPAGAQDATADESATANETIVVTGSRIRRDPVTAPTPLIQVSRESLLTTGQNTVIDYLSKALPPR